MSNNNNKRRLKGYYGFSKKYPSQRGTVYAIGESRKTKKKELCRKILLTVFVAVLLIAVLIFYFFCRNLSRRPIPIENEPQNTNTAVSAENIGQIKAIFIDNAVLGDEIALTKELEKAKDNGFNSVMLDFKDSDGSVLFPSSSENLTKADGKNSVSQTVLDLIKGDGFSVVARIYCFCDSYAPQRTGAYVYEDSELTKPWFDAPSALGGKVWLNPANSKATDYLLNIVGEAASFGADCIYLQNAEFPVSKENPPVFTEDDASLSRNFILLSFIENAVKKAGKCPVIVGFSYDGIDGDSEKWGGTLFDSAAAGCSPEIPMSDNYAKYAGDLWLVLNERAKSNFSTLIVIPTVKDCPDNEQFYKELTENGAQSFIIIP